MTNTIHTIALYQQQLDYYSSIESYTLKQPSGLINNTPSLFINDYTVKQFYQRLSVLLNCNEDAIKIISQL